MTEPDPLQECLLGLHAALDESVPLIIAGGYGLYLKQRSIVQSELRTLFRPELLPDNRTTHDIDLFLRAEVVVSAQRMKLVRDAVDGLGFAAVPGSEYLQFAKPVEPVGSIKLDLMVGPLGDLFDPKSVKRDDRRVRPRAFGGLHAHPLDEAVAVEEHTFPVPLGDAGVLVYVPQSFTYLPPNLLVDRLEGRLKATRPLPTRDRPAAVGGPASMRDHRRQARFHLGKKVTAADVRGSTTPRLACISKLQVLFCKA